jgi:tRNA 2-thiouridine synthesizing protein A
MPQEGARGDGELELAFTVIEAVEREAGGACTACRRALCGHDVVMSFVLGFKSSARCLGCLARGLGRGVAELHAHLLDHIHHRECWSAGWRRANELESLAADARSGCARASSSTASARSVSPSAPEPSAPAAAAVRAPAAAHARWDAGDLGCGDLVLELRTRLNAMRPGERLELTARDPGAPADLPAWCGMTGHRLISANHPEYLLERRND